MDAARLLRWLLAGVLATTMLVAGCRSQPRDAAADEEYDVSDFDRRDAGPMVPPDPGIGTKIPGR